MFAATTRVVDAPSSRLEVIASSMSELTTNRSRMSGFVTCSEVPIHPRRLTVDPVQRLLYVVGEHADERPTCGHQSSGSGRYWLPPADSLIPSHHCSWLSPSGGIEAAQPIPVFVAALDGRLPREPQHVRKVRGVPCASRSDMGGGARGSFINRFLDAGNPSILTKLIDH